MYPVIVVHFQPLLCQAIDSRSRPRHVCLASGPHARMSLLAVTDGGQPQPHRFHPPVPVLDPALTDVPVGRLPRFGLVTCGGLDAQRWGNLGNRGANAYRGRVQWRHVADTGLALVCLAGWGGTLPAAG
jgi:hypothetical protein